MGGVVGVHDAVLSAAAGCDVSRQESGLLVARLEYRPPYRFGELLEFFRVRALEGVEVVGDCSYARTVRLRAASGMQVLGWLRVEEDAPSRSLLLTVPDRLAAVLPQVVSRVRRQFDVDCDPQLISAHFEAVRSATGCSLRAGTRLPGCFEPFETACRAVLGQQVSVKAANRIAARVVEAYGVPVSTGVAGLTRAWPTPGEVLQVGEALSPGEGASGLEEAFGQLGVVRSRTRAIAEIARLLQTGELELGSTVCAAEQMERLLSVKGIGPWTAGYIAMRAMGYADAFLETDAGVAHALPELSPKERLALAEQWRPWRSYAVIALWNSLGDEIHAQSVKRAHSSKHA